MTDINMNSRLHSEIGTLRCHKSNIFIEPGISEKMADSRIEQNNNQLNKTLLTDMNGFNDAVGWDIQSTTRAQGTVNPIRRIVEGMKIEPNPDKKMIPLSIGDPTKFGNMVPSEVLENAIIAAIKGRQHNGYGPSIGHEDARAAVAKYVSTPEARFTHKDVILASGCSDAIDIVITGLVNPGEGLLIPRPGFSLYRTLANPMGITVKYYNLMPEKDWEIDLDHLDSQIDSNTRLIVVNNPSNPCGSVYSKQHLHDIISLAKSRRIPILADEVYEQFVFPGEKYYSMASCSSDLPILSCGGLTKRFIVPGWRMGWLVIHDPAHNLHPDVRQGFQNLSQRIVGPNTIVQAALPHIFDIPRSYFDNISMIVCNNAKLFWSRLSQIPGLTPVMPRGAMYIMVEIDLARFPRIASDMDFVQRLVNEQSVFVLPGSCFQFAGFFRAVLTLPQDKIDESCDRIEEFCKAHYR